MPGVLIGSPVSRGVLLPARYDPPAWWTGNATIPAGNCLIAYMAKGAASLAASKVNLANPGTYDATNPVNPTPWDATNGWKTFNSGDHLATNYNVGSSSSPAAVTLAIRIGATGTAGRYAVKGIGYGAFLVPTYGGVNTFVKTPDGKSATYAVATGTWMMSKTPALWYNGSNTGATFSGGGSSAAVNLTIGADAAGNAWWAGGTMQAFALYDINLSDAQAAALHTAMMAL